MDTFYNIIVFVTAKLYNLLVFLYYYHINIEINNCYNKMI